MFAIIEYRQGKFKRMHTIVNAERQILRHDLWLQCGKECTIMMSQSTEK